MASLRLEVEAGCAAAGGSWPERVVAGIQRVLAFAAAHPDAKFRKTQKRKAAAKRRAKRGAHGR